MQPRPSRWVAEPCDVAIARRLAAELGVSEVVGTVLARRGFADPGEARRFLAAGECHDPLSLPGVPAAREVISDHVRRGSRIAVFGDYDVDGVCSTAMLVRTLRALGSDPIWELPSRFDEGYGLSAAAVERLAARGASLLVTVDCGITALEAVAAARAAGIDVVVTDHHRPPDVLPDCPVVHPAPGGGAPAYPAELCAAGVVLKLSHALRGEAADEDLDLAALATVCDLVPLRGENRRLVREGLVALERTEKPGLHALMKVSACEPGNLAEHALGFRLGPRINAAGRMGRADAALELLLTEDGARAEEVANDLDLLNRDRREAETRILFAADTAAAAQASRAAVVVAGEGWHPGVVGIVASRLVEKWRRPAVVIALEGGRGRGSGRSISAYDLHAGLSACSASLERFGGHRMAAGVELGAGDVDEFARALAAHAGAALSPEDLIPVERVDAVVPGSALGLELAEELEQLRPFGMGNPQPTFLVPGARLENVASMGEERQHARFTLVTGAARARGVAFGQTKASLTGGAGPVHAAIRLERNSWNGAVEPRVVLRALCPPRHGKLRVLGEDEPFWTRLAAELRHDGETLLLAPSSDVTDRRGEGAAAVVAAMLAGGVPTLVAVADVSRRRAGLEAVLAGMAEGGLPVVSWQALARRPALAAPFDHLVALDPPPGGLRDPLLRLARWGHAAWGPAEAEFAVDVWRAELSLRPLLTQTFRALRRFDPRADGAACEAALRGPGPHPVTPETCARVLRVLGELGLARVDCEARSIAIVEGVRTDLELSPAFRGYQSRFEAIEAALAPDLTAREQPEVRLAQAS